MLIEPCVMFSPSCAVLSAILRDEYLTSAVRTNRFSERHFSANCISLRLSEVQTKFYERSLQALLSSAPRGFAARSRVLARLASLAKIGELARRLL